MVVKEARVVCGKARTCKLSGGKVIDVYDEDKKVYVPYEEFLRQHDEKGEKMGYKYDPEGDDDIDKLKLLEKTKDEKKEYFTTHGKKTKETKEDKKSDSQNMPSNIITTSGVNLSNSGTSGTIPIADYTISAKVTIDDSKVDSDIVKITNKKKEDPYDWYIKKILKL